MNPDSFSSIIELQQCIGNMDDDYYDEAETKIIDSIFVKNKEKYKSFFQSFFLFISIRLEYLGNYARLTSLLVQENPEFKIILLRFDSHFKAYKNYGFYIRICYDMGIFSLSEIKNEILSKDGIVSDLVKIFFSDILSYCELQSLQRFSNNIDEFKEYCVYGCKKDSLEYIFKQDNIEQLQYEVANGIDFEQSVYMLSYSNFTLLQTAAMFGAVKCFKYLLLNGCAPKSYDKVLVLSAIQGGNIEIIHLIDEMDICMFIDEPSFIEHSIIYHRNDILKWLIETKFSFVPDQFTMLQCINNFNPEALLFFMENYKEEKSSFYNAALFCDFEEFIEFFDSPDFKGGQYNGMTACEIAIWRRMFKYINTLQKSENRVFEYAIKYNYTIEELEELRKFVDFKEGDPFLNSIVAKKTGITEYLMYYDQNVPPEFIKTYYQITVGKEVVQVMAFEQAILTYSEEAIRFFLANEKYYCLIGEKHLDLILNEMSMSALSCFNNLYGFLKCYKNIDVYYRKMDKESKRLLDRIMKRTEYKKYDTNCCFVRRQYSEPCTDL